VRAFVDAEPGVRGIRLYVDRRNVSAQEVYTRLGMDGGHYQVFEWMKCRLGMDGGHYQVFEWMK
jgi:hypothetical protein